MSNWEPITKPVVPLTEGYICKGGHNPPTTGTHRPPPPKGSDGVRVVDPVNRWQVGDASDLNLNDPIFVMEDEAINVARARSQESYYTPFAVWDKTSGLIVRLFLCGQEFKPA